MEVAADGIVHLGAQHAPVPDQPPPALEAWVRRAGDLIGWRLDNAAVLAEAARLQLDEPADPVSSWLSDTRRSFAAWQETWLDVTALGDQALLRELQALIAEWDIGATEVSALISSVKSGDVRIGTSLAVSIVAQAADLGDILRQRGEHGIGLYAVGPTTRLVAGFVPFGEQREISSSGGTTVQISRRGLVVLDPASEWRPARWELHSGGVSVDDTGGRTHHLDWDDAAALTRLAPGATIVEVRPALLTALFADPVVGLTGPLAAAVAAQRPLVAFVA